MKCLRAGVEISGLVGNGSGQGHDLVETRAWTGSENIRSDVPVARRWKIPWTDQGKPSLAGSNVDRTSELLRDLMPDGNVLAIVEDIELFAEPTIRHGKNGVHGDIQRQ